MVGSPEVRHLAVEPRGRVRIVSRARDDDLDALAEATTVVGLGRGVDPSAYDNLAPLLEVLHAELGATRKVTDSGWLPRSRQIGITGRNIAPSLFVSIGASGSFNHMVGVRNASTVLAINRDPNAPVFDVADVGIIGDWQQVVPLLVERLKPIKDEQ
jgi:electron transfer flavoprotein alpha subunit